MDMEKTHSSLFRRMKVLEQHAFQGTTPSGLRIKNVKANGQNVEALQAMDSLRSEVTSCKAPVAECQGPKATTRATATTTSIRK